MSANDGNEPGIAVLTITPRPTSVERDAIVAALVVVRLRAAEGPAPVTPPSRWAAAARREGIRRDLGGGGWR